MKTCDQCGNPVSPELFICPYCGGQSLDAPSGSHSVRTLDLGHAGLTVTEARGRLEDAVLVAGNRGDRVLVVVHGYGSSGIGGRIASMVRSEAAKSLSAGHLLGWIAGEDLGGSTRRVRYLERRLPALADLEAWKRRNPGITLLLCR